MHLITDCGCVCGTLVVTPATDCTSVGVAPNNWNGCLRNRSLLQGVQSTRGQRILMVDADGATEISDLARLEAALDGVCVCVCVCCTAEHCCVLALCPLVIALGKAENISGVTAMPHTATRPQGSRRRGKEWPLGAARICRTRPWQRYAAGGSVGNRRDCFEPWVDWVRLALTLRSGAVGDLGFQ